MSDANEGSEGSDTEAEVAAVDSGPPLRFGVPFSDSRGQAVLHPQREHIFDLALLLRDEKGFGMCMDVTAVDFLLHDAPRHLPAGIEPQRYEVVIGLLSHVRRERLRLRVQVPEDDPVVPSLFDIYPGVEALEREVFDMFGIRFDGHPDMTRILMPEDWEGYPLRKHYPAGEIPVQFKGVTNAR